MTTESSTEKKDTKTATDPQDGKGADDKTVPVAALADQRAKTRAAKSDLEAAQAELAKAREQQFPIDMDSLVQTLAAETRKTVEAELAPLRQEATKYKMAATMGLNESQAEKVMELRSKNPGLSEQQALLLAKTEHPDVFPTPSQPPWSRAVHGGLPVSGDAPVAPQSEDYVAKMKQAREKDDWAGAQHFAEQEALRRFRNAFNNRPR
jgi:hypothetical protein